MHLFLLLFRDNRWQDLLLTAGNVYVCCTLVPMLRDSDKPPLATSIPTAFGCFAGCLVMASLHLWFTALSQIVVGLQWVVLARQRTLRTRRR